ncbi:MAG TPA: transcription-repair coupling factor [Candidatus Eisenbacteria bacterium]|nr:transcription-repair coupling factor [Candidatus Eisenbacteria bacterium]
MATPSSAPVSEVAARLLEAGSTHPALRDFSARLAAAPEGTPLRLRGVAGSAGALVAALMARSGADAGRPSPPLAIIAPDLDRAEAWRDDLSFLLGPDHVVFIPPLDTVAWSSQTATAPVREDRLHAFLRLGDPDPPVAIIPALALHRLTPSPSLVRPRAVDVAPGITIAPEALLRRLVLAGYRSVAEIGESGEVSRRGGIVDVFGPGMELPARIEFDGDTVASLRSFDVTSQRSTGTLETIRVIPARELLYHDDVDERLRPLDAPDAPRTSETDRIRDLVAEGIYFEGMEWIAPLLGIPLGSVLDYLPPGTALWIDEPAAAGREVEIAEREAERLEKDAREKASHLPARDALFESPEQVDARLKRYRRIESALTTREGASKSEVVSLDARPQPSFGRKLDLLRGELRRLSELGVTRIILCDNRGQAERLEELLGDGLADIVVGDLSAGFVLPGAKLAAFTDHEIFARYRRRRARKLRASAAVMRDLLTLTPGDYVVHLDHGIGVFRGMKPLTLDGQETECIQIDYAGGDRLFVPIGQLGMVERYSAEEGKAPVIHKLGGTSWARVKAKTRKAIADMAEDLLRAYAVRKARPGRAFSLDTPWQRELESSFIYEETPDQLRAVEEVKRDMEAARPMDRLICGDVGYGKTEVAIRAAFKAIQDGTQVAILVPTTVLAQQHFVTFSERFADFPVRVDMLSRFRSAKEQKETVAKIAAGDVDLVIGTHRLLSKDVVFKNLGLVVIDEEQRFGVAQKERIRTLVETVDVLTLTATPIPRTLHMSLLGARDMSVMTTPPRGRYPIKTEIVEMSQDVVREALLREVDRGGQSFFVHNRVETIDRMAHYVRSTVPQVRVGVAHGQMRDTQLEKVMVDFIERRTDTLVSTMIIESGLDIPTVNTMLVNRADTLGLAQLYQLRGRIGRSHHQAFCHLLVPAGKVLTEEAEKRLRVIAEHEELGAGLMIAMRDLEIRGAGNLLGPEQHGHMLSVGFDLYCRMVDEVVNELQGQPVDRRPEPEVSSSLPAFVPEEYIEDRDEKLDVYRRMAALGSLADLEALRSELRDRFGPMPDEVEHLLALKGLRLMGKEAGAERLRVGSDRIEIELHDPLPRDRIMALVPQISSPIEFSSGAKTLRIRKPGDPVSLATKVLRALAPADSVAPLPLTGAER